MLSRSVPFLVLLIGCGSQEGVALLDYQSGDVSALIEVVSEGSDGNRRPQDLAFNKMDESELWVVNRTEDSVTIHHDVDGDMDVERIVDPFALHFMEKVSSIAWGEGLLFATCQDSRNTYNGQAQADDFTGPTLWTADPEIFGITNPEAVEQLTEIFGQPVNLGSHLDMLHESPQCMGIEWDEANVYWVFDGLNANIVRYDFAEDHGPGFDDHSDGVVQRHMATDVSRKNGVVSHLVMDQSTKLLYVADTGNNRIMVLDTRSGSEGQALEGPGTNDPQEDCWAPTGECVEHVAWTGSDWTMLIDGDDHDMVSPAGIELVENTLFVSDAGTGFLYAFDLEGNELDRAFTGITEEQGLQGITARGTNELWMVNAKSNEVLKLSIDGE
ncbi:MAG: hypothetical protein AAGA48_16570 [Myxococcota bacterium]